MTTFNASNDDKAISMIADLTHCPLEDVTVILKGGLSNSICRLISLAITLN